MSLNSDSKHIKIDEHYNKIYIKILLVFCDKGFYSNTHQSSCIPCDIGYFKKERGNALKCTRCPDGFLTPNIASTSLENCNERM